MWARAVWTEGTAEEEGVIPKCWVKEMEPTDHWESFPLLKLKIVSGRLSYMYKLIEI